MRQILAFLLMLVLAHPVPASAMRQPAPLEANEKILSGLEESLWVAERQKIEEGFLEDLRKLPHRRTSYTMYVRELAYRERPEEDHPHHVGAMVSLSPNGVILGFLPLTNAVEDPSRKVRVGLKIHLFQELLDHHAGIELIVQRPGKSYRPGGHLDFVFRMRRRFTAEEVRAREMLLHYPDAPAPSAGMEEGMEAVSRALQAVGISPFQASREVLEDPALWKEAVRRIPRMLQGNPHVFDGVKLENRPVQIGWGLELARAKPEGVELAAPQAGRKQAHDVYIAFANHLRQRFWEIGAATKIGMVTLWFMKDGVFYVRPENSKKILLQDIFIPEGLWQFLADRDLNVSIMIRLDDNVGWEQLPWLLDPRTLRENIPVAIGQDRPVQMPMRGPRDRALLPLRGFFSTVRKDLETGQVVPVDFTIASNGKSQSERHNLLERTKAEFLLEYWKHGYIRPGHFGWKRRRIEKQLNQWFGEGDWHILYRMGNSFITRREAVQLYEEAYFEYFQKNPKELNDLLDKASDIYDTAPSNVESQTDYSKQETGAQHLHDIAIRRVVKRLGQGFRGDKLVEIRGPKSEGFRWNPGVVPFHRPDLILQPALRGWWAQGSIEDFFQSNKAIVLKRQPNGLLETVTQHLASFLYQDARPLREITAPFWLLGPSAFPVDEQGRTRKFTPRETEEIIGELTDLLTSSVQLLPVKFRPRGELGHMQSFRRALESGGPSVPDAVLLNSHLDAMPLLFRVLQEKGGTPIFLARDALTMYEFGTYAALLQGTRFEGKVLYHPGAPRSSLSVRANEPIMEHVLFKTAEIMEDIRDELKAQGWMSEEAARGQRKDPRVYAELERRFTEKVRHLFQEDPVCKYYALGLYRQVKEMNIPSDRSLIVVDTNATGRTALFVRAVITLLSQEEGNPRSVEVLLGWAREKQWGIPELSDFVQLKEEPFHDLHWPFVYHHRDPISGRPIFLIKTNLSRLLFLVYQSIQLYNTAVDYTVGLEERMRVEEERYLASSL